MSQGALSDITVLDMTRVLSGPFAATWLGEMGANVIKIEIPNGGDESRRNPPFSPNGTSAFNTTINRNKRSITLDLKKEEGKEIFRELVKQADVVLENFRPDVMDRLGLGYEDVKKVNERIIYATISGFGQTGKYAKRPAYDIVAQGMGGIMSVTGIDGGEPNRVGASVADVTGGMNFVIGILAALHARSITGKGQCVDIALVDSVLALMPSENMRYYISGKKVPRLGNRYLGNAPYGAFKAKDDYFVLACGSNPLFYKFAADVLKRPELCEDERFRIMANRSDNYPLVKEFVEEWASQHTAKECVDILLAAGIPAGPIYDMDDIVNDDYFTREREMLVEMEQPGIGKLTVTNNPIRLSETKSAIRRPAPLLGQHNAEVYGQWLNYGEAKLEELKSKGVI